MRDPPVDDPVWSARESVLSRLDRWSFYAVIGTAGSIAILLLIAPTVIVVITSFTNGYSLKFPPPAFGVRWYSALWTDSPDLARAALTSLQVSITATAASTLLAGAAALAITKRRELWARLLDSLFMSPMMLPPLALGLALLAYFNMLDTGVSMTTLVIGHVAITTPYILRTTVASYSQLDPLMLESARSLGARPWFMFRTVTLPLIAPGLMAGAFIAFMVSFDNVAVSLFLSDARSEVLPVRLWTIIESNLDVRAAAVSGVLITTTITLAIVMERIVGLSRHIK